MTLADASGALIRTARPDEAARAWRLFRVPFPADKNLRIIAALQPQPRERLIGCAAIYVIADPARGLQGQLYWQVLPAYQGKAIERELITVACQQAQEHGLVRLLSQGVYLPAAPAAILLQELGFCPGDAVEEFEAVFEAVRARSERVYRTLEQRGAIPHQARIEGLGQAHLAEVRGLLHQARIMDVLDFDMRLSGHHPAPLDGSRSTVIALDNTVVGVLLVARLPDQQSHFQVPARWVAPAFRRGWVNAALIYHSCLKMASLGLSHVRFLANTQAHRETLRLARRLGGGSLAVRCRYVKEFS